MEVLVIGAGVMGLSSAILLHRAGIPSRIVARDLAPGVTSCIAAAFWEPFKADPIERVMRWGAAGLAQFIELAEQRPQSGVVLRRGASVFPTAAPEPWWRDIVPAFERLSAADLPSGSASGFAWTTAVIETPIYIPWLMREYEALGGIIEQREFASLDQALSAHDVVIHCTGLGARELTPDPAVYPSRGQLVRVQQFGLEEFRVDDQGADGMCYIIPRSRDIVLGGTLEDHVDRLEPDAAAAEAIVRRCARLVPEVARAKVLARPVGLRPRRAQVRLEMEQRGGKTIIHNYGHGGAGISLSWGCAQEVLGLVRTIAGRG